jgi:lipopolysaccharide/colanic/teichoic acid biosynthesis glycosyltransferase
MKRLFDVILSSLGLVLAGPFMLIIAGLIKIESRGPVFYRCTRVGKGSRLFGMLKFRTMVNNADSLGCSLCSNHDVRVTPFGAFLRRTKLNELPQLMNVLLGDMSLVGPRPEDPKFVKYYADLWEIVLSVEPGIVGPNQISNRNEDELLGAADDPEEYYVHGLLPEKLQRDIDYVRTQGFATDVRILYRGIYVTVFKALRLNMLRSRVRVMQLLCLDLIISVAAYILANMLRHETLPMMHQISGGIAAIIISNPFIFVFMGLYRCSLRFFSVPDLLLMGKICLLSGGWLVICNYLLMLVPGHSRMVYILYPVIMVLLLGASRVVIRSMIERRECTNGESLSTRVIIYGAGRLGMETYKHLQFQPGIAVIGFVDDDERMKGKSILGTTVLGSGNDLPQLKILYRVDGVVIAFRPPSTETLRAVRQKCARAAVADFLSPAALWTLPDMSNSAPVSQSSQPKLQSVAGGSGRRDI